jgi:hypothetical protein
VIRAEIALFLAKSVHTNGRSWIAVRFPRIQMGQHYLREWIAARIQYGFVSRQAKQLHRRKADASPTVK